MDTLNEFINTINKCALEAATFPEDVSVIVDENQTLADFGMDSLDMSILFLLLDDVYPIPEEEWYKHEECREQDTPIVALYNFINSQMGIV